MRTIANSVDMVRLRDFSTAFSRSVLTDILLFDDFSHLNWLHSQYHLKSKTYIGMVRGGVWDNGKELSLRICL